jgi:hypothetical protein
MNSPTREFWVLILTTIGKLRSLPNCHALQTTFEVAQVREQLGASNLKFSASVATVCQLCNFSSQLL